MSLRKDKIVEIVMGVIVFCVLVQAIMMPNEYQNLQITEYCIDHPNGTIEGDIIVNCSEWLEDHPELVKKCMAERRKR